MAAAFVLVLIVATHSVQPSASAQDAAIRQYRAAAEAQLRCDETAAMAGVIALDLPIVNALAREIARPRRRDRWPPELLASGVLLNTRAALTFRPDQEETEITHLAAARRLLEALAVSSPDLYRRIGPAWFAIVAARLQSRLALVRLARHLNDVPVEFAASPLLLLARGSMHQLLASAIVPGEIRLRLKPPPIGGPRVPEPAGGEQRVNRDLAEKEFRGAIAAAPDDAEAYIRLADILNGGRRRTEATQLISRAERLPRATPLKYWSALVEGRIKEDSGDLEGSRRAYARALALVPTAQAAQVALADVNLASGRAADAAAAIRAYLVRSAHSADDADDPWWQYMFGQSWRIEPMLDSVLREVRSCTPR